MEPLLPETAEGRDACPRPDEDARMGGVLRELEVAGTGGDRRRDTLVLRHHGMDAHAGQGARDLGWGWGQVWLGMVVLGGAERTMSSNWIPKRCRLLPFP